MQAQNKGFTLAETMVVLVLVGLMVAMAQLNIFSLLGRSHFKGAVQDFMNTFRMAIKASVETGRRYEITIDLDEQSYQLREITGDNLGEVLSDEVVLQANLPADCHIDRVEFDDGEVTEQWAKFRIGHAGWAYGGRILLSDDDGHQYTILINRLNRMVELVNGESELLARKDDIEMTF